MAIEFLTELEIMAHYTDQILAPAEGFGHQSVPFLLLLALKVLMNRACFYVKN